MITVDLKDKTVMVVGGARGIGAAIVRGAADAGANVAWTYSGSARGRKASKALSADLPEERTLFDAVDCSDVEASDKFLRAVLAKWGKIDCLVCNAGLTNPKNLLDITPDEWRRYVEINLNGVFVSMRMPLREMAGAGGGSIVLIGSAAVGNGGGGRADYVSAKAGLEALAKAVTKEFASKNVRCNVVHPSLIMTDLLRERYPDDKARAETAESVPLGRLGTPEDIANLALFLLSDLASYITGQSIYVDGGRTFCK